ncbi:hypothetical protein GCM10023221_09240 [Luteimicrobium xylanilyticum]|uniref:DUF4198 domain-containing protein n=1 Tax=Luteimicrobium xylanilyticum TaxID=1133546 RepID=A0A5P9QCV8_9MICO|nr:hypothetical protein [Luteimicrobium xylanilyticum]QFU99066.1 hypothetical protein KDY119_02592 [Luteimicrobium xylanilyticum]
MIRRIIAAGSAAAGLVLAGAVAPAVAAGSPSPEPLAVHVTTADVVLKPHATRTLTIKAALSRPLAKGEVAAVVVGPWDSDDVVLVPLDGASGGKSLSTSFPLEADTPVGNWGAEVGVFQGTINDVYDGHVDPFVDVTTRFHVKLPTAFTVNASPEPAAYGETITVAGSLTHYSQTAEKNTVYKGKTVDVYFDPAGKAPRAKVATVTTDSKGQFAKKFTAKTTGVWSAQFAGTSSYAAVRSNGDNVAVAKKKTHLTLNAGPEPAKKGSTLTVAGRLTHATSVRGKAHYTSYHGKTLTVWFNPTGPKGATKVATVTTNAKGEFSKKLTQSVDGTWQVTFAGTKTYAAATSNKDHVDVK